MPVALQMYSVREEAARDFLGALKAVAGILAAAETAGVDFYVVGQDKCRRPPQESVALSLKNLRTWGIA